jgi:hypothetical protein
MSQQHLLVALAVILMITNVLGLAFTVWRNRHPLPTKEKMRSREPARI